MNTLYHKSKKNTIEIAAFSWAERKKSPLHLCWKCGIMVKYLDRNGGLVIYGVLS
jgi:hypothetical protein